MQDKILETTIPFSGFYNSWHDQELDNALDMMFSDENGDTYPSIREKAFDLVKWKQVHTNYAKEYTGYFANKFNLNTLKFLTLESPKYYNYSTDRIICNISLSEVTEIYNKVDKVLLTQKIKEWFTSYDGFHSFYPNDFDVWSKDLSTWDCNHIGTLLHVYAIQENNFRFEQSDEIDLLESSNEVATNVIYNNMEDASRLFKIADYLRERENRA